MKINTKYLGEVQINKEQIISFPKGLLGFEDHKEFVVLSMEGNTHFKFLQDIHHDYISFLIINPWDFFEDYDIELPDNQLNSMGIFPEKNTNISIYNIVTIGKSLQESTCNLLAPIVINLENKKGRQFILDNSPYTTKHRLLPKGEE
ncbi:flagellar assembly protein FliW [Wansuia hejianensis]|uniref:Flagellar assembly factor FliW n=1 Tax=Wansuia hejianensis TaxID=2763667 RepID=A0A926ILN3_9FIRM|nr:flagellar assembly protein FliW [Wansuia hejianensis]MBC8590324.1 flagellar assembly protein FliW [Wansuia hejianensis]